MLNSQVSLPFELAPDVRADRNAVADLPAVQIRQRLADDDALAIVLPGREFFRLELAVPGTRHESRSGSVASTWICALLSL